eukprot:TRINITY_DN1128_c0_g1_i2.p2 TRINITY_DN1128_c0_g1~~TRINITY_DN1128_c0_g1_i2.p2  ORF type:complete len:413 (+),score=42.35 TRINITY_DN1128_c0_g1_i2:5238-6476(+)
MPIPIISGPYKTFRPILPGHSFVEYEGSTITIPLTVKLRDGVIKTGPIQLEAFMRLEVFPAYVNGLRTREFQFTIRDWELFGYSELLNELFYGDPSGRDRDPGPGPYDDKLLDLRRREIAVMTFTLSRNYFKYDDDDNANMGAVETIDPDSKGRLQQLSIDNLTSHDIDGNWLYWQIEKGENGLSVFFHCKPPLGGQVSHLRVGKPSAKGAARIAGEDRQFLLARAETGVNAAPLKAGDVFVATLNKQEQAEAIITPSEANATISKLIRPQRPISIRWRLGTNPTAGDVGRIRIVSPAKSLCTAHQGPDLGHPFDSTDFPARIMYAASYHIYVNNKRFVEDQAGIAIADGVHEIPPRDVTVAFDKPHAGEILGRYLEFGPGHCTGMHEISVDRYLYGKSISEYWRTQPLSPV